VVVAHLGEEAVVAVSEEEAHQAAGNMRRIP
jgi:hypothetical protein